MKINNVQLNPRNEVIVVTRKPAVNFGNAQTLSKGLIDRYGLDMTTRVGYKGEGRYKQAPENLPDGIKNFLRNLKINWATHVDENTHKTAL